VTQYSLYENGAGIYNGNAQALSASIGGRGTGSYRYKVQACNSSGCSAFTSEFLVTVLLPPGTPATISAPYETGPSYTVSWSAASGSVDRYDLDEQFNGGAWTTAAITTTSKAFTAKPYGSYGYRVRACNASGCSAYVTASVSVSVITGLSAFPDTAPVSPTVPAQGWVGALPGTAGVEGGAAMYRIPIEVPPGRAGLQPEVSLNYSSRNGNGVAGVGWAVSVAQKIYRCPRTLAQDNGGRTVQQDAYDRICYDGQRLVSTGSYGTSGSQYRTEIDQYDRITLNGDLGSWTSYFEVEHKSGRISQFEPGFSYGSSLPPDTWYLVREFDRHGNCILYNYSPHAYSSVRPSSDQNRDLDSISYTGTGSWGQRQCNVGPEGRQVRFIYENREDIRTTYQYGVGSVMSARLQSISTMVGSQRVRVYQFAYHSSRATRRSILEQVTLCIGATATVDGNGAHCGAEKLPSTLFTYQEDPPTFDRWHAEKDHQPLSEEWSTQLVGDLDGDGVRDSIFSSEHAESWVQLSACPAAQRVDGTNLYLGSTPWNSGLGYYEDLNRDGRVDVMGTVHNFVDGQDYLTLTTAECGVSPSEWAKTSTDLGFGTPTAIGGVDYDGDGLADLRYANTPSPGAPTSLVTVLHRSKDITTWTGANGVAVAAPALPNSDSGVLSTQDINGDGLVDTIFDSGPYTNQEPTRVAFYTLQGSPPYQTKLLSEVGGPGGSFKANRTRRWIDVNGDGLPDIYDPPGNMWINTGGKPGEIIFRRVNVSYGQGVTVPPSNRAVQSFVMDVDGDGRDELMGSGLKSH